MNEKRARECLQIGFNEKLTHEKCRQQYRKLALKYHPDKNKSEKAHEEFHEIVESYEYLSKSFVLSQMENDDYNSLCHSFLKTLWREKPEINEIVVYILSKISQVSFLDVPLLKKCVETIPINSLKKICQILERYSDVFNITNSLIDGIKSIIEELEINEVEKPNDIPIIYIYPCIDDILDGKVYTWKFKETTYIIPLWHDEMIFEDTTNENKEIIVRCVSILQENFYIDENKTIVVSLKYNFNDLPQIMSQDEIEFFLGEKRFSIIRKKLFLCQKQNYEMKNCGIPMIDKKDMLNIQKRGNIKVIIEFI
jgi:hypothetical protein